MPVSSLGFRTDIFFIRELGEVEQRQGYTIARTPSNPTYYFGNFLIYDAPPSKQTFKDWVEAFQLAFPDARHSAYGWQDGEGDTTAFRAAGYRMGRRIVLTAAATRSPRKQHERLSVRPLESTNDWSSSVELQIRNRDVAEHPDEARYRDYKTKRMTNYRLLHQRGLGYWYGGFLDDTLVGSLGIFVDRDAARYQQVDVDAAYRRRGICGTMVHAAAQHIAAQLKPKIFVIVTDADYHAAPIYESAGFVSSQSEWSMWKRA